MPQLVMPANARQHKSRIMMTTCVNMGMLISYGL